MTIADSADVEIYLGAAIEHASERDVLKLLVDHLSGTDRWSIILANINVGGRQIDFVVATDSTTLVIEAKRFSRLVRGGVNGVWEMRTCGDAWVRVGNPYLQVLDEKNALRDRMRLIDADIAGYPDACVAITPRLPAGSDVPASDYKVGIVGLEMIPDLLNKRSDLRWPRDRWRELAANLHLERVQSLDAAFSPKLREHENLLSAYAGAFYRTYASDLVSFQQDSYLVESNDRDAQFIVDQVTSRGVDLLIRGPSGCGKTLLAKQLAISCMQSGDVPVFIPGKYFAGSLRECIDREVALLEVPSVAKLLGAVRSLGKRLLLIVDGYNECHASEQLALTRSLAAVVRRYGAQLIVSSQGEMVRQDLVETLQVLVREPNISLKTAIANASAGRPSDKLEYLLGSVTNGLEADLVGRVGSMLPEGASRFALFDAYARQKFVGLASDGIRFMAAMALQLTERLSFSMSVRDLDRLAAIEGVHGSTLNGIVASGLLMKRTDRVSFCHELIFSAFAAEAVVRESAGDVGNIMIALAAPKYHASRALIVGAIDDENLVIRLLENTADADLLRAALEGECGAAAQRWVESRCGQVVEKTTMEAANLTFSFREDSWARAGICSSSLAEWSPSEYALLGAVADNIWRGFHLRSILHAVGVLDKSLSRGHAALKDEALATSPRFQ